LAPQTPSWNLEVLFLIEARGEKKIGEGRKKNGKKRDGKGENGKKRERERKKEKGRGRRKVHLPIHISD